MSYKYLPHEADFGILAEALSLEKAFEDGASAMFAIMVPPDEVKPAKEIKIVAEANDEAALFVEWLNKILTAKDIEEMFFSKFNVTEIIKKDGKFFLKGSALGEKIDLARHHVKTEVKAATYFGLKYWQKGKLHFVQCVVDV